MNSWRTGSDQEEEMERETKKCRRHLRKETLEREK